MDRTNICKNIIQSIKDYIMDPVKLEPHRAEKHFVRKRKVTVHSVPSNTLRDAKNMNLLVQSPRSIVCFANLIYVIRVNSRGMSRDFGIHMPKHLAG